MIRLTRRRLSLRTVTSAADLVSVVGKVARRALLKSAAGLQCLGRWIRRAYGRLPLGSSVAQAADLAFMKREAASGPVLEPIASLNCFGRRSAAIAVFLPAVGRTSFSLT